MWLPPLGEGGGLPLPGGSHLQTPFYSFLSLFKKIIIIIF